MALQKAKQMALEQAGTYVESYTKVQNYQLTADEIQTIAGGVLQVEVLDKTRTLVGDGLKHYVKIKATVTTDKVAELAERIKGKNVAEEYKKLQEEYARLSKEVESWKHLVAKTPAGPERDAALDQIREGEKAFSTMQKREATFFQRLVSGEVLITQGLNVQDSIDRLFQRILREGHVIAVGQPNALPDFKKPLRTNIFVPLTLSASSSIILAGKNAAYALGGIIHENQQFELIYSDVLTATDLNPRSINATLLRVAKDLEFSRYFQERIGNLTLFVEISKDSAPLAQCFLRYYTARMALPIPASKQASLARVEDSVIDQWNELHWSAHRGESYRVQEAILERVKEGNRDLQELLANLQEHLPEDRKATIDRRYSIAGLSEASGVFLRVAPVSSRLKIWGLYRVGFPSNKLSRHHEDNGFVVIPNDPAMLKLEFSLPTDKAKEIESIRARVVEMTVEEWERQNDENRCKVVR